ncbi:peptidoglycan DD-metalloendopeptidase family protein [Paenibacillus albicereus]|uniref:Peptidoglycan DD-metalloendopeptidase family protein n=1 Tax=Paenibacillus albicereus TaxID=2726185 RepID=A0A6H2H3A7_9BACL|nr:peptidoglycan DD-metalloendopeptidase family protein [Paenibacillus albicereus]QJC54079.1 peptidoglycan DD-metalloendopeptidase family protein [Paenibacillus albicereus]
MIAFKRNEHPSNPSFPEPPSRRRWIRILLIAAVAIAALAVAATIGTKQYINTHTYSYYKVLLDGQAVGTVEDPAQVDELVTSETAKLEKAYPNLEMKLHVGAISFEEVREYKGEPQTQAALDKLASTFTSTAVGTEVIVGGKVIGVVKNEATAQAVLKQLQDKYAPPSRMKSAQPQVTTLSTAPKAASAPVNRISGVKFAEKVEISPAETDPAEVLGQDQLLRLLSGGMETDTKYTVQAGDCVGCIASKFDISPEVIYKNNPAVQDDLIKAGDVLDLTVKKPAISVVTTESQSEVITTEPQVIIQNKATLKKGESKVIQEGQAGSKRLTYAVVKQNGYKMSEELVSIDVLAKSVPKIIVRGTKVVGEGSGTFSYPVSGARITSTYGTRWGRLHKGIDLVGSSTIKAADEGVVEFAGTKSGYGNVVIVNHRNGYKTLYGHLRSISVSAGETLERGEKLGIMGNTGRSTGTHLHFEISKNGALQNPLKYL